MDKTLLKGLTLLEALADQNGKPVTIQALADIVGWTRSNAHRTLQTLAYAGYATRDEATGSYRSTYKLFELGSKQISTLDVRRVSAAAMQELAALSRETVHLSVLDGGTVVYVDKIDSPQPVRAYSAIGGRAPAYCVATGKILLAHQAPAFLVQHLPTLVACTKATITDLTRLEAELGRARSNGFAVNRGEWRESVGGVAAPVFDPFDRVVAAIGISGPLERLTAKRIKELTPGVQDAAKRITRQMRGRA